MPARSVVEDPIANPAPGGSAVTDDHVTLRGRRDFAVYYLPASVGFWAALLLGLDFTALTWLIWLELLPRGLLLCLELPHDKDYRDKPLFSLLPVVAVVSPAVFLKQNAIPHAVNLTPAAIEYRELARRTSIPTSEVSQVITVRTARREVFMVRDRGGKFVAFGPGLSRSDFEAARAWLRALAQAAGIEMREGLSVQEAMFLLHPGGPTRPR